MEVDILEFRVPVDSNKTVFVWDIPPVLTHDQVYEQLFHVFSSFGPIYLLKVSPNAPLHPPGFYAIIKFYSAAHAATAQKVTDGCPLLQNSALKVKLSSKQTPHFSSGRNTPLSHARCLELANHCLGFNGWTCDIITLKELTNEEEGEDAEDEGGVRQRIRFGCMMKLSFPQHGVMTRGAAVVEESFTCTGPEVLLQRRCKLQRSVREKALVQAFSSVLLILLGNGKVMVELKQTSDQLEADETEDILQVNEFSLSECPADEEEAEDEDWDLTVS
ncbi:RAD52 motif-containing protein 1-like [Girardinichthys multiradiatus]|uniref:RAD52 motif-containing protein 1-like n=1 Tax=Girardinichthys multiradiatus TaxID=208333 RepID=UPI001FACA507|nr:RAD52 motif-containing protein 1-like [Girardinichthys multiradiatus]XP_047213571.1 RAD52 motif-containing protein 1-like [Girardinichthys multiradiatus]XP_047213572.1 RAD52 motif-containing protein 1-like [Girardinichthys multiradiatus]XP_047215452.1 RAD52 motif-containing protein 1-like [Girardinichthys multiradiatus]XP_047215453.1 RAD52 motif-containing protein 1-like [Girardinichthys multiradiatus]XP_047215454.1 RAD52 motif-containing protein 1-like [Girardinichthys multiradiatus]